MNAGLPPAQLPASRQVNVKLLGEAFETFSSSYKILIMKAILHEINEKSEAPEIAIDGGELIRGMLAHAWFPSQHFNLRFGEGDQTADVFKQLILHGILEKSSRLTAKKVRARLDRNANKLEELARVNRLLRHPPYLIIKPWFKDKIQGGSDEQHYSHIAQLSCEHFGEKQPLYRFELPSKRIVVHPYWIKYLRDNMPIVEGWLDSKWLSFLESKNPSVPTLLSKLWDRPATHQSLKRQKKFWRPFFDNRGGLTCIYSLDPVPKDYVLDHFLPRSWVGHDQIWNLIPTSKIINEDKSDGLPDSKLITKLADAHYEALSAAKIDKPSGWERFMDEYRLGLRVEEAALRNRSKWRTAYRGTVQPMLMIASRHGFQNWKLDRQS